MEQKIGESPSGDVEQHALAEIGSLITERYLKPEPGNIEALVEELFTDPATSFGATQSLAEFALIKAKWFGQYERWQ